jgi:hypothetical protein
MNCTIVCLFLIKGRIRMKFTNLSLSCIYHIFGSHFKMLAIVGIFHPNLISSLTEKYDIIFCVAAFRFYLNLISRVK